MGLFSKKKQTIGYWYQILAHWGLAKSADALLEFRGGDREAFKGLVTETSGIGVDKSEIWGGEKSEGGLWGDMDIMFGRAGQVANDFLTAHLGPEQPTYRGKVSAVWRGGYYGTSPYPKPVSFKLRRIFEGWDDTPWYPEKAAIVLSSVTSTEELGPTSNGWRYKIVALADADDYSEQAFDDSSWAVGQMPFASAAGQPHAAANGFPALMNTSWPLNSKIWLRKTFVVDVVADINMEVFIDNFASVWVNGIMLVDGTDTTESKITFTIPSSLIVTGANSIVLMGKDDAASSSGDYSYAAFKLVSAQQSPLIAMNPAHILYDSLISRDMMGEPAALISAESFEAAADQFYSEGFGLCTSFDDEDIEAFQQRICDVSGACLTQSRVDGLYYLDLIRETSDIEALLIIGDDDVIEFSQEPTSPTECVNQVSVEWFDPERKDKRATPPLQALGAIQAASGVIPEIKSYPEIAIERLALRVAARDLQAKSSPLNRFTLVTNRRPWKLRPGQKFRLQYPTEGIADMVCLVGDIDLGTPGDSRVRIKAIQDVYSFPSSAYVDSEPGLAPPLTSDPEPSPNQLAIEMPYVEFFDNLPGSEIAALPSSRGFLMTIATQANGGFGYSIFTGANGDALAERAAGDWCPTALIVEVAGLFEEDFTIADGIAIADVVLGSWALWGDEIVRVDAISATAGTLSLGRGCADTVPRKHDAGSRIYFCGNAGGSDEIEYVAGDVVTAKLLSRSLSDLQKIESAPELTVTMNSRQSRPYPPGNLKVNGAAIPVNISGPVTATWAHRDKVQQANQLLDTTMGSVGPEVGTTYRIQLKDVGGVVFATFTGITAAAWTWPTPDDTHTQIQLTLAAVNAAGQMSLQAPAIETVDRYGWGMRWDTNWSGII